MNRLVSLPRAAFLAALAALVACGDDAAPAVTPDAGPGCGRTLPGALTDGHWDDRFGIAGVGGHDGLTPKVFDFAVEPGGSVLAVGDFEWLGDRRVAPLLRYQGGTWTPARDHFERPVPASGFAAVAVDESGQLALATYDPLDPRTSEIWVDRGQGLEVVGTLSGLARSLAWYDQPHVHRAPRGRHRRGGERLRLARGRRAQRLLLRRRG